MPRTLESKEYRWLIDQLTQAREAFGLTQDEVGRKLGKPQSWVAKTEGFERRLDVIEYYHLCRAVGVSSSQLMSKLQRI